MTQTLGLCIHLENQAAATQIDGWNFVGLCRFQGKYLGAGDEGLVQIGAADTDNGTPIIAAITTPLLAFGNVNMKRIRSIFLGGQINTLLNVTVYDDGDLTNADAHTRTYQIDNVNDNNRQQSFRIRVGRDGRGRYWMFRVFGDADGAMWSMDELTCEASVLARRPRW